MRSQYKNKDLLKNQPFYSEEIKSNKKRNKEFSNIKSLSQLPFFPKKSRKLIVRCAPISFKKKKKI